MSLRCNQRPRDKALVKTLGEARVAGVQEEQGAWCGPGGLPRARPRQPGSQGQERWPKAAGASAGPGPERTRHGVLSRGMASLPQGPCGSPAGMPLTGRDGSGRQEEAAVHVQAGGASPEDGWQVQKVTGTDPEGAGRGGGEGVGLGGEPSLLPARGTGQSRC